MTLLSRTAGLLLAIAVASQALAPVGTVLVCRYTGKVLDPCACPQRQGPEVPSFQTERCCELRAAPPSSPAIMRAAAPSLPRLELTSWALPATPPNAAPDDPRSNLAAARPQAPPRTPRYLSIRTLLI